MSLFTRLFASSSPSNPLIVTHPRLSELRSKRFMLWFESIFCTVMGGVWAYLSVASGIVSFLLPALLCVLLLPGLIGFYFVQEHWWKRIEALRLAAVQEDRSLLADVQPEPNADALRVPVKVTMRFSRRTLLISGLFLSLIVVVLADAAALFAAWGFYVHLPPYLSHPYEFPWPLVISLTVIMGGIMALAPFLLWHFRSMVEVRPEGIRSWAKGLGMSESEVRSMPWHEARLFVCYPKPGFWNNGSVTIYELSSANRIVLWNWVHHPRGFMAPTIPLGEHQAQMRALCGLVAAKTGLPLYDLSKGQMVGREGSPRG